MQEHRSTITVGMTLSNLKSTLKDSIIVAPIASHDPEQKLGSAYYFVYEIRFFTYKGLFWLAKAPDIISRRARATSQPSISPSLRNGTQQFLKSAGGNR
jgi:hypothetical protein